MGVLSVTLSDDREASLSREGLRRIYRPKFIVETSGPTVTELEILVDPRLPVVGVSYYNFFGWSDFGAKCVDVKPKPLDRDSRTLWLVETTFDSAGSSFAQQSGGGSGSSPQTTNPLFDRIQRKWATKYVTMTVWQSKELNPKPFVTSAGEPFADGFQMEVPLRSLHVVRNEPVFDAFDSWGYENTVNADVFQNADPGTCLCQTIDADSASRDGIDYEVVSYDFLFAGDHLANFLDKGSFFLEPLPAGQQGPKTKKNFMTKTGQTITEGLLDGSGGELAAGAGPKFLGFVVRYSSNFAEFDLPDPI